MTKKVFNEINVFGVKDKPAAKSEPSLKSVLTNRDLILLIVGGIALSLVLISWGKQDTPPATPTLSEVVQPTESTKIGALERDLENKLAENLSQMQGVGQVRVSVALTSGLKNSFAKNESVTKRTSKETDNAGGTRETTEVTENNQLVMPNGVAQPVIVMEERPEVAGVLVIAEGAQDPRVKEALHNAVKTLLDIPANRITVEAMGGI